MGITRRDALRRLTTGTVSAVATGAAGGLALSGVAASEEKPQAPAEALGMLYDATRCVGCQSCVAACAKANNLAPDIRVNGLHQIAYDLNATTKNIIKLYKPADGKSYSYVKQQCMHCVDPACVAGCMFKGLKKRSADRSGQLEFQVMRGLPLLRDRMSVPHPEISMGRFQSKNCEVRVV